MLTENEIKFSVACCNNFLCNECYYQKYDSDTYKLRCIHLLVQDVNKLINGMTPTKISKGEVV